MEIPEVFKKVIEKWGVPSQLEMAVEECSELIRAIQKLKRYERWGQGSLAEIEKNIIKEIADVSIMVHQLRVIFGTRLVDDMVEHRMERLVRMLNDEDEFTEARHGRKMTAQEAMDGSPSLIETPHIRIQFQHGVVPEVDVNGTTIREVIQLLINRLTGFQEGDFACEDNAEAIKDLTRAHEWLDAREEDRKRRGVEGKHKK